MKWDSVRAIFYKDHARGHVKDKEALAKVMKLVFP